MSDSSIILIPESAGAVPSADARLKAVALLKNILPVEAAIDEELSDDILFIDCGSNFQDVRCPACGNNLETDWWQNEMSRDSEPGFQLQPIPLPCCHVLKSLHELVYDWPQGFARYSIEVVDPTTADLTPEDVSRVETALGCKVRKILKRL